MQKLSILLVMIVLFACSKKEEPIVNCFSADKTVRTIASKMAKVVIVDQKVYLVEEDAIDGKLLPCRIADEFKVDGLSVRISGNVKQTPPVPFTFETTDNFELTNISKP